MFTNLAIVRGPQIVVKKNHGFRWRRAWHRVGSGFGPGSSIGRHLCGQRCGASKVRAGLVLVVKFLELLDIWVYIYMEIETFWESSEPVIFVGTGDSPRVGLDFEPKIHPIHCWDNPVNKKSVCVYCILFRFTGKGLWSWAIPQVNEQLARKKLKQMHKANDDEPDLCSCFVDETIRATEQTPAIGSTPGIDVGIQKL